MLAGKERVAGGADIHPDIFLGGPDFILRAAGAGSRSLKIFWMNFGFHKYNFNTASNICPCQSGVIKYNIMVQHIGLLMTHNEEDCIKEVMDNHVKYFDKILCLDGSSDRTEEIVRSYPQVRYFLKDKQILDQVPMGKIRDGARQFILAKAQEIYGYEGWFSILHGDEIFHDNPLDAAEAAEKEGAEKVNWYVMNFFLHTSDKGRDFTAIKSLQERLLWYCPGFLEIRQFKNKRGVFYDVGQRGVLPKGIGWRMYSKYPVYKHYPYRSTAQMMKKRDEQAKSKFSNSFETIKDETNCYRNILPGYKVARKFDGSFHEFELNQQGSILWRWLRSYRYLPVTIGNPFA